MDGVTPTRRGDCAEAYFRLYALSKGWEVATPISVEVPYDFLVRMGTKEWKTVQVKSARGYSSKNGARVNLKKHYKEGDFDYLFAWDVHHGSWLAAASEVPFGTTSMHLSNTHDSWEPTIG